MKIRMLTFLQPGNSQRIMCRGTRLRPVPLDVHHQMDTNDQWIMDTNGDRFLKHPSPFSVSGQDSHLFGCLWWVTVAVFASFGLDFLADGLVRNKNPTYGRTCLILHQPEMTKYCTWPEVIHKSSASTNINKYNTSASTYMTFCVLLVHFQPEMLDQNSGIVHLPHPSTPHISAN